MSCIHRLNGCQISVVIRVLFLVLVMIYGIIKWISYPFPGNQKMLSHSLLRNSYHLDSLKASQKYRCML